MTNGQTISLFVFGASCIFGIAAFAFLWNKERTKNNKKADKPEELNK